MDYFLLYAPDSIAILVGLSIFVVYSNYHDNVLSVFLAGVIVSAVLALVIPVLLGGQTMIANPIHYAIVLLVSVHLLGYHELGMNFVSDIGWIWSITGIVFLIYWVVNGHDNWAFDIDFDSGWKIALIAGVIGSMYFATISPVIIPYVHHGLAKSPVVESPAPEFPGGIYEESLPYGFDEHNDSGLRYYEVWIVNDFEKPILELTLNFQFRGCVDDAGSKSFVGSQFSLQGIEPAPPGIVRVPETFSRQDALTRCDQGVYVSRFPAKRLLILYFIVDRTPEEQARWNEGSAETYDSNEFEVEWSYVWEYRSVRIFVSDKSSVFSISDQSD